MLAHEFTRSSYDCVYYKGLVSGSSIYLLLYVVDMLLACKHLIKVNNLKKLLSREFALKDIGEAKKILGMEIH